MHRSLRHGASILLQKEAERALFIHNPQQGQLQVSQGLYRTKLQWQPPPESSDSLQQHSSWSGSVCFSQHTCTCAHTSVATIVTIRASQLSASGTPSCSYHEHGLHFNLLQPRDCQPLSQHHQ